MPPPLVRRVISARPLHAVTYLFAVALFSISFLVFLNSSLSFVLTTLFHVPAKRLGSVVGTLGFVDELVVIVAAPLWGLISDGRIGTKGVSAAGYAIIALSLVLFVNIPTVYPGLIFGRILFSLGAAAVATMVSALLPEMTAPECGEGQKDPTEEAEVKPARTGKLAGIVGMFTGFGALLALYLFLPLPTRFASKPDTSAADAVRTSYYIVAIVALVIAFWCIIGLPPPRKHRPSQAWKNIKAWIWQRVWGGDPAVLAADEEEAEVIPPSRKAVSGFKGLWAAAKVGFEDGRIGVGYVGGFVARASSVGISLFIPLFVNHYFISTGRCHPTIPERTKEECRNAYMLASELTGVSQVCALVLAPLFGYITDRCSRSVWFRNAPLILSSILGILGFTLFSSLSTPHQPIAFFYAALMGASQIGAIVASLGILSQGVVEVTEDSVDGEEEEAPLLVETNGSDRNGRKPPNLRNDARISIKGSIAGVYSLCGGVAILLLTKAGGELFDLRPGAPFWFLASLNAVLLFVSLANMAWSGIRARERLYPS